MNQELISMAFTRNQLAKTLTMKEALFLFHKENLLNVGELTERAIVKQGKLTQQSKNFKGSDFVEDDSDSKYVQVRYYAAAYATIAGIQNKIGTLRVLCYEPKQNKNYYFLIPYEVYAPYTTADDSLKIWFDKEGNPRRPTRSNRRYDLWDYQCTKSEWSGKLN
jgi:hypothetical protein